LFTVLKTIKIRISPFFIFNLPICGFLPISFIEEMLTTGSRQIFKRKKEKKERKIKRTNRKKNKEKSKKKQEKKAKKRRKKKPTDSLETIKSPSLKGDGLEKERKKKKARKERKDR